MLLVRRRLNDGAKYFGPCTDSKAVRKHCPFCGQFSRSAPAERILSQELRIALLKLSFRQVFGTCAGLVSVEDYRAMIDEAIAFLEGKVDL